MPWLPRCLLALVCSTLLLSVFVGGENAKTAASAKTPAEIERLIKQLGSDDFEKREAASKALATIGEPALEALQKAASESSDAEVRRRAERLINALEAKHRGELRCFKGHTGHVWGVAFSPDGKGALSGSWDKTMRLWQLSPEAGKAKGVSGTKEK